MAVAKIGPGAWKSYSPSEFGGRDGHVQLSSDGHEPGDFGNVGEAANIKRRAGIMEARGELELNLDGTAAGGYTEEQARDDYSPK